MRRLSPNRCRLCGELVPVKDTVWMLPPYRKPEYRQLMGCYCSSDCLIMAWERMRNAQSSPGS